MDLPAFRDTLTNAIRYWERGRLFYNVALLAVVGAVYVSRLPDSRQVLSWDLFLGIFVLAVLANVAYCAAYAVDLVVQFSGFRAGWLRFRWALLALGTLFASVITQFVAQGLFEGAS